jgi:DNA-binding transcriptional LysR family regulator
MHRQGWRVEPTMQLDNFDLIINLVSLGMGISFVRFALWRFYNQRQRVLRVPLLQDSPERIGRCRSQASETLRSHRAVYRQRAFEE